MRAGFSLTEILVVAVLLGGLALVGSSIMSQFAKNKQYFDNSEAFQAVVNEAKMVVRRPDLCNLAFRVPPVITRRPSPQTALASPSALPGGKNILASQTLTNSRALAAIPATDDETASQPFLNFERINFGDSTLLQVNRTLGSGLRIASIQGHIVNTNATIMAPNRIYDVHLVISATKADGQTISNSRAPIPVSLVVSPTGDVQGCYDGAPSASTPPLPGATSWSRNVVCSNEVTNAQFTPWTACPAGRQTVQLFCMARNLGWGGPPGYNDATSWRVITNHAGQVGNEIDLNGSSNGNPNPRIRCWAPASGIIRSCASCVE